VGGRTCGAVDSNSVSQNVTRRQLAIKLHLRIHHRTRVAMSTRCHAHALPCARVAMRTRCHAHALLASTGAAHAATHRALVGRARLQRKVEETHHLRSSTWSSGSAPATTNLHQCTQRRRARPRLKLLAYAGAATSRRAIPPPSPPQRFPRHRLLHSRYQQGPRLVHLSQVLLRERPRRKDLHLRRFRAVQQHRRP
jgi:hypothetical protein